MRGVDAVAFVAITIIVAMLASPLAQARSGGFIGLADFCLQYGVEPSGTTAGNATDLVSIDVTSVMRAVHLSPFVSGVVIYGGFQLSEVVVRGVASSKTYVVVNGSIRLDPRDLDDITGLTEPLTVTLVGASNVHMICLDLYDILVLVRRGGEPVDNALVVLIPLDGSHDPSYYVTSSMGTGVVNFLPNRPYRLVISGENVNMSRELVLSPEHNGAQVVADLATRRVTMGGVGEIEPSAAPSGGSPLPPAIALAVPATVAVGCVAYLARVGKLKKLLSSRSKKG